jgi:hypothetical protein
MLLTQEPSASLQHLFLELARGGQIPFWALSVGARLFIAVRVSGCS